MIKFLKRSVVIALCAGFAISAAFLSACADKDLISGNFRKEATAEQLAEVKELVSEENAETIVGDTTKEGWSYNARFVTTGNTVFNADVTAAGKTFTVSGSEKIDAEHIMSLENKEGELDARGSGNVNYSSSVLMSGLAQKDTLDEQSYKGQSYSDMLNYYIDGEVKRITEDSEYSRTGKIKISLAEAFEQFFPIGGNGEVFIDLGVIRSMFGTEGVKVYIDDSADFKVKISLDVNVWLDLFASDIMDIITMTCGITISEEDMLENSKFNHADYFLQFDKQTKQLLGYGSKFDLSFDINFQTDNVSADIGYDMNRNSWMVKSDVPAAELPEDTDSYENITGGLF